MVTEKQKSKIYATISQDGFESTIEADSIKEIRTKLSDLESTMTIVRIVRGRELKFAKKTSLSIS